MVVLTNGQKEILDAYAEGYRLELLRQCESELAQPGVKFLALDDPPLWKHTFTKGVIDQMSVGLMTWESLASAVRRRATVNRDWELMVQHKKALETRPVFLTLWSAISDVGTPGWNGGALEDYCAAAEAAKVKLVELSAALTEILKAGDRMHKLASEGKYISREDLAAWKNASTADLASK